MKREDGGDILVSGSADLVNGLMERGLIDEYQIFMFPVVLGSGKHLFRDGIPAYPMQLMKTQVFDTGVVLLVYEPGEEPEGQPAARGVRVERRAGSLAARGRGCEPGPGDRALHGHRRLERARGGARRQALAPVARSSR